MQSQPRNWERRGALNIRPFQRLQLGLRAGIRKRTVFASLAEALVANQLLWTVLGADVADEGNSLPEQLRAQLFYLTEFTNHQTRKIMAGEAEPGVLVEINISIMRGLRDCVDSFQEVPL